VRRIIARLAGCDLDTSAPLPRLPLLLPDARRVAGWLFDGGIEAPAGMFEGDWLNLARIELLHAPGGFLVPGGLDGFILRAVEAFDQGTGKFGAFRHWESERLFQ
jgi:hypothetical protein